MSGRIFAAITLLSTFSAFALSDGSVRGNVTDNDGVAVDGAQVQLADALGHIIKRQKSSATGDFSFFPIPLGQYQLRVEKANAPPFVTTLTVSSGGATQVDARLGPAGQKEIVMDVRAKRHLVQKSSSTSATQVDQSEIKQLPQGDDITLPKLFATTQPGAVQGPFGQTFFRGNHANIQYQIDGVQLPDSPSNTFGQAFSPRNIDHMEVITGGVPAEYGERLAAVVNMVTKTGPETRGGTLSLNYGSYQSIQPTLTYGGSTDDGRLHYYVSANYMYTNRGIDTPQPKSDDDPGHGGAEAVHDRATSNNEFLKLDWQIRNNDKLTFEGFYSQSALQIPNYPDSFGPNDPIFSPSHVVYGNTGPFSYLPSYTNDYQEETNGFLQFVWKHSFNDHAFMQIAPYYKYSYIHFQNDPVNDLYGGTNQNAYSFYESRPTNNFGLKGDYTERFGETHLFKAGLQVQSSIASGKISTQNQSITAPINEASGTDHGAFESVYAQDDWSFAKRWVLNIGLRFDATQFAFGDSSSSNESSLQPRIGINYMVTDTTKLHAFYGRLFQPAPLENLRETFQANTQGQLTGYDIKAEKDDYFEVGVTQQFLETQVASLTAYYKNARDMLDDQQLFNTSIAQPYNFAKGYAYGIELALKGEVSAHWSDYLNYSYETARGQGVSGGLFAFSPPPDDSWKMLDHVQVHTLNAGTTYHLSQFWWTLQGLFGSGLRTDPNNNSSLPAHVTFDTTVGYEFKGGDVWPGPLKLSGDILNIFDNPYPITVANGFNGSHYAAGRVFYVRLTKEF